MNFYTYARHYGDKILVRGVKEGRRFKTKQDFRPTLFVKSDTEKMFLLFSLNPTRRQPPSMTDIKMFLISLYMDRTIMVISL